MTRDDRHRPDPRHVREVEGHLDWLGSLTGAALGVLSVASGIYTYIGVRSLLEETGSFTTFAALAYSVAVSVGIFVFWSYLMRLLPAMRTAPQRMGLFGAMALGSLAIVAMSSWLNAAALAGSAAVEQHLAETVQDYQASLERTNEIAVASQGLERDVARVRQSFEDLSEQEASGDLSGFAGRGAVFRVLRQKAEELAALEGQIQAQAPAVATAFAEGNAILSRMRALTVEPGAIEPRTVEFSEDAVRLSDLITRLDQLSVAPLVARAANDLSASVVRPALSRMEETAGAQSLTIDSVIDVLAQRAETLGAAAAAVAAMPRPAEISYTPISAADAVILYAGNFVPSWAGAIAIDLLPAVLVLILMVAEGAIRASRDRVPIEDSMTVAELRAAMLALRDVDVRGDHAADPGAAADTAPRPATEPDAAPQSAAAPTPLRRSE